MSRNKDYQHLLNSKRWRELRAWKLQRNPLCEMCLAEGFVRSAVDVHHIIPVESAKSLDEMERLCLDPSGSNLMSLCIPCHIKVHKEMRKGTKDNHKERSSQALERWKALHAASSDLSSGQLRPEQGSPPTAVSGESRPPGGSFSQ